MTSNQNDNGDKLGMAEQWSSDGGSRSGNSDGMSEDSVLEAGYYRVHDAVDTNDMPVIQASMRKHAEKVQKKASGALLDDDDESEADIDETDEDGCTPLHTAVLNGNLAAMEILLINGCDVNKPCAESPIVHLALSVGAIKCHREFVLPAVKLLVKHGANLFGCDRLGLTVFHLCAEFELEDCAAYFLESDTAKLINATDRIGQTALHRACISGSEKVLKLLLDYKPSTDNMSAADVNIVDRYKQTALHLCAAHCFVKGATILVSHGADTSLKNINGNTAGEVAEALKDESFVKSLEPKSEAECESPPKWGKTLLLAHEICSMHYTCDPVITSKRIPDAERPSENVNRLTVLLNEKSGILRSKRLEELDWQEAPRAQMVDVLRVHEAAYIAKLQEFCSQLDDDEVGELDGDTSISGKSFEAAMHAAGAVCEAVDRVCQGTHRNAFCAIRPPGHHAGPTGVVTNKRDPHGSYGFCLLSNATIAAAYARNLYRHKGISKVAIVDFDVHHGNGTEECIRNLVPTKKSQKYESAMCDLVVKTQSYKPWLNEKDIDNVYFASVHGFGKRDPRMNANAVAFSHQSDFYPSSGEHSGLAPKSVPVKSANGEVKSENQNTTDTAPTLRREKESEAFIVNYGQQTKDRLEWRASWNDHILPSLVEFNPDLIIISAGFDAHEKDEINFGYLSINENDYTWLSEELVKVANKCCDGRVVSVLEGGYKIQGKVVSPFARSVYAHVASLVSTHPQAHWNRENSRAHLQQEYNAEQQAEAERIARSLAAQEMNVLGSGAPKKRELPRRAAASAVDYAKLNAELDEEVKSKRARLEESKKDDNTTKPEDQKS